MCGLILIRKVLSIVLKVLLTKGAKKEKKSFHKNFENEIAITVTDGGYRERYPHK